MANKTVEEIVEKAKSGDMSAFDLLYREYSEKLLKYVIKLGADRNDAEDIVSDSFVEAIEHIGDLKNNAFFSTWLHSIAKNKVYTMKKKEQKHARVDFTSDDGDEQNDGLDVAAAKAAEYNGDTIMLPEDYAENEDIKQILADTINSLNPDQRDAIYLFYYKNNSISEIAEQTGVSENTVKSRLSLARKYMERKLKKLQKNGVVLCAVPIPVILNIVVSESRLKAAAPVITTAAGGATSGAAVSAVSGKIGALIAAGIMIGGGVGIYSTLSDRSGNIHKGDIRTADNSSVMISDASSIDSRKDWDPDLIKVVDTDTVESTIAVDDASSQTDNRPTNTNQGNTRTVQQGQQAQPTQQVITYYDEDTEQGDEGGEDNDNDTANVSTENGNGNNSNRNDQTQTPSSSRSTSTEPSTTETPTTEPRKVQIYSDQSWYARGDGYFVADQEDLKENVEYNNLSIGKNRSIGVKFIVADLAEDYYSKLAETHSLEVDTTEAIINITIVPKSEIKKGDTLFNLVYDTEYPYISAQNYAANKELTIKLSFDEVRSHDEGLSGNKLYSWEIEENNIQMGIETILHMGDFDSTVSIYVSGVKIYAYE